MTRSTSTALVLVANPSASEPLDGCRMRAGRMAGQSKWILLGAAMLAMAGLALGSSVLGFAALLPLLYALPCLLMLAMCMFGMRKDGAASGSNAG